MNLLEKHGAFVKDQIFLQNKLANRYAGTPWRAERHSENAKHMEAILADLGWAQKNLESLPQTHKTAELVVSHGVEMKAEDLNGLPPELLEELSLSETDKLEFEITEIIKNAGGILPLNKILIGLFRKTGTVHKRPALTSRLYRMAQRRAVYNVPEKKGFYSTKPLNSEEVKSIFGIDQAGDESDEEASESATV